MSLTAVGVRRLLQVVGVGSLLCGIVGAAITGGMVYIVSQRMFILPVVAAYHSLYVVAIINLLWLGTLVWYGTRLLRGETAAVWPFCGVVASEVLYAWATVALGRQLNVAGRIHRRHEAGKFGTLGAVLFPVPGLGWRAGALGPV